MGNNIIESILARTGIQQPKVPITSPPLSGPGSGVVPSDVPAIIEAKPYGPYLPDGGVCIPSTPDSWDFEYVTLRYTGTAPNAMLADFYVQLRKPYKKLFMVGNNSPTGQALFIHFNKLNKYVNGVVQTIFGDEPWIPFPGGQQMHATAGGVNGEGLTDASYIQFCKPISKFYATIYNSAGSAPTPIPGTWNITLLATDDIDKMYSNAL